MTTRQPDPSTAPTASLPERLWAQRIPLHITHASSLTTSASASTPQPPPPPLITTVPRFGYLSLLLPRLSAYFGRPCSSFHHEDVLLRNHAAGLLVDLHDPPLPWRLVVSDGEAWDVRDTFVNGAKEADFVRYGSARGFMGLAVQDTEALWDAVRDSEFCRLFFFDVSCLLS